MGLFLFFISVAATLSLTSGAPPTECCLSKSVGGVEYVLAYEGNTSPYHCLKDCVYEAVDHPGSRFCFAPGHLPVVCEDVTPTGPLTGTTEGPGGGGCICPAQYDPVCGVDGVTYSNGCEAGCAGVEVDYSGECESSCICPAQYDPVCGVDGETYSNSCEAGCAGVDVAAPGECKGHRPCGHKDCNLFCSATQQCVEDDQILCVMAPCCARLSCASVPPTLCPSERPDFGSSCQDDQDELRCEYGQQECCGDTYPDLEMECMEGAWQGIAVETPCFALGGQRCPPA